MERSGLRLVSGRALASRRLPAISSWERAHGHPRPLQPGRKDRDSDGRRRRHRPRHRSRPRGGGRRRRRRGTPGAAAQGCRQGDRGPRAPHPRPPHRRARLVERRGPRPVDDGPLRPHRYLGQQRGRAAGAERQLPREDPRGVLGRDHHSQLQGALDVRQGRLARDAQHGRRRHHQRQLRWRHFPWSTHQRRLYRLQGRPQPPHQDAGAGDGALQHPRQRHPPRLRPHRGLRGRLRW